MTCPHCELLEQELVAQSALYHGHPMTGPQLAIRRARTMIVVGAVTDNPIMLSEGVQAHREAFDLRREEMAADDAN